MDYIDRLKKIRQEKGMRQIDVSAALGSSHAAYGLYETRQRKLDVDMLLKLCAIFEVTPNQLLGFEE